MNSKLWKFVLILSLSTNLAFVGTWAAERFAGTQAAGSAESIKTDGTGIWCPLHRKLGVTQEQWRRIEPEMKAFHEKVRESCKEMQGLRREMMQLLSQQEPDREAISAQQQRILDGQRKMQDLVLNLILTEKEILTAEQENELFEMLREGASCGGPGRPGMMGVLHNGGAPDPTEED
jgi:Spy/CpxP family protein refolding chaperone